jgi:NADH-quinone oxidoreductase subunit N
MTPAGLRTLQDLVPEAILLAGALTCAGLGAMRPRTTMRVFMGLSGLTLLGAGLSSLVYLRGMPAGGYAAFSDGLVVDRFTVFLSLLLCGIALLAMLCAEPLEARVRPHAGEYSALVLAAVLGGVLLVAARELVEMWVALELLSLALTAVVALVKVDWHGGAAALRLVALSGAGSAVVLYGMALLYGLTGTTVLTQSGAALRHSTAALALASALLVGGVALKLGAAPLQQWTGDVARSASAPVAGLVVALGPVAGVAALARLLVVALPTAASTWTAAIAVVGIASLGYGSLAALRRTRLRRVVADLAVAQLGLILLGLLGWRSTDQGIAALLLGLVGAGVALAGTAAAVVAAEAAGLGPDVAAYRGLSRRSPLAAVALAVCLLSLAGFPPLLGFFGRVLILEAAVSAGYAWILAIVVPLTVAGLVAALRVVVALVVEPPEEGAAAIPAGGPLRVSLATAGLATVFAGVAIQPLLALALGSAGQLH